MKDTKYTLRIKDLKYKRVIGKIARLRIEEKVREDKIGNYSTRISIQDLEYEPVYKGQNSQLKRLLQEGFSILIMNGTKILGEYECYTEDIEDVEINIYENKKADIKCSVIMNGKLTNQILSWWNIWCESFECGIWKTWGKIKRSGWIEICNNHRMVTSNYHNQDYYKKEIGQIYLNGESITDMYSFICELGEAFFGPGGDYERGGYGYPHDRVAMAEYTRVYWENFNMPEDPYNYLAYYIRVLSSSYELGAEVIICPKQADDVKERLYRDNETRIYLDGTDIIDNESFIQALGKAVSDDRIYFKDNLQNVRKKSFILIWINYEEQDRLTLFEYISLFMKYNIPVIFTPVSSFKGVNTEVLQQIKNRKWGKKELRRYIQEECEKDDVLMMDMLGMKQEQFERILKGEDQKKQYIDINRLEEMLDKDSVKCKKILEDIKKFRLYIKDSEFGRLLRVLTQTGVRGITTKDEMLTIIKMVSKTIDEVTMTRELARNYEDVYKAVNDMTCGNETKEAMKEYLARYVIYIRWLCKNHLELVADIIKKASLEAVKNFEILVMSIDGILHGYTYRWISVLFHKIDEGTDHSEQIAFLLDVFINDHKNKGGKESSETGFSIPEPTIYIQQDKVNTYCSSLESVDCSLIEEYGQMYSETYNRVLVQKLKDNIGSLGLWKLYYRDCIGRETSKLQEALNLMGQVNQEIIDQDYYYTKQYGNKIYRDQYDKEEFQNLIVSFKANAEAIIGHYMT